jgi:hypothetical protein
MNLALSKFRSSKILTCQNLNLGLKESLESIVKGESGEFQIVSWIVQEDGKSFGEQVRIIYIFKETNLN